MTPGQDLDVPQVVDLSCPDPSVDPFCSSAGGSPVQFSVTCKLIAGTLEPLGQIIDIKQEIR